MLTGGEIDAGEFRLVLRSAAGAAVLRVLGVAGVLGAAWLLYWKGTIPLLVSALVSMFCAVFLWRGLTDLHARMKATNWLVGISDAAVYVKFRSYLYPRRRADEKEVVRIEASEIEAFRVSRIVDIIPYGRTKRKMERVYVDLHICGDLGPLERALAEAHRTYGLGRVRGSRIEPERVDFPVVVARGNVIRIDVSGVRSGEDRFAEALRELGVREMEPGREVYNLSARAADREEVRARIVDLLKAGRWVDARDAIAHVSGVSRKEAWRRADAMMGRACRREGGDEKAAGVAESVRSALTVGLPVADVVSYLEDAGVEYSHDAESKSFACLQRNVHSSGMVSTSLDIAIQMDDREKVKEVNIRTVHTGP